METQVCCPTCKGKKEVMLTVRIFGSNDAPEVYPTECVVCKGAGVVHPELARYVSRLIAKEAVIKY